MQAEPEISIALAEAEAFARRLGATWFTPGDIERLREAMATIADAGRVVPRPSSKFDQPAYVFSVGRGDSSTR